jgi:hypothetical protein
MPVSLRRLGIAFGALVEAGLVVWLASGFLPAWLPLGLLTVLLGFAIYRDILSRRRAPRGESPSSPWHRPVSPVFFALIVIGALMVAFVGYAVLVTGNPAAMLLLALIVVVPGLLIALAIRLGKL